MLTDEILKEVLALSPDERRKLIEIITESLNEASQVSLQPRVLGLGANSKFWISDDFDDPIFPEGWMDDPSDPLNWTSNTESSDK